MDIYIVIPTYNEEDYIGTTLKSLVEQTTLPKKIVVVNDGSTDSSPAIINEFVEKHDFISVVNSLSITGEHAPGSKVINAFYEGYKTLDANFDIICKFDADLNFPPDYLEKISVHFQSDPQIGMAGGFCTIQIGGNWKLENLTSDDHIRGALKAYRKECFHQIGGLIPEMGWDTVDELLAQFHGWKIKTDKSLQVKHLKPTGRSYTKAAKYKQGKAFYRLGYGPAISLIASAKLAYLKKDFLLFIDYLKGYYIAKKGNESLLVTKEEGRFIRNLRWKKMLKKMF